MTDGVPLPIIAVSEARSAGAPALVPSRTIAAGAVLVAVLSINLRPAVTSIGAELVAVKTSPGVTTLLCAVLVAVPVWCFAGGSSLAWLLRARWGMHPVVAGALGVLALSLATRCVAGPALLLVGTMTAGLAIAVLGALLPVLAQAGTPQAQLASGVALAGALGAGSAAGALLTPAIAGVAGWRVATAGWALLALVALVCWRATGDRLIGDDAPVGPRSRTITPRQLAPRWSALMLTGHFGALSGVTFVLMGWLPDLLYDRAGVGRDGAALLFTVVMTVGIPVSLVVPVLARRMHDQVLLAVALVSAMSGGVVGLLVAPTLAPLLWAVLLGVGMGAVALALTMITLRAGGDRDVGAALSSLVQAAGYAIAGVLTLLVGIVHATAQGWQWPLVTVLVVLAAQTATGVVVGRRTTITARPALGN